MLTISDSGALLPRILQTLAELRLAPLARVMQPTEDTLQVLPREMYGGGPGNRTTAMLLMRQLSSTRTSTRRLPQWEPNPPHAAYETATPTRGSCGIRVLLCSPARGWYSDWSIWRESNPQLRLHRPRCSPLYTTEGVSTGGIEPPLLGSRPKGLSFSLRGERLGVFGKPDYPLNRPWRNRESNPDQPGANRLYSPLYETPIETGFT